MKRRWIPFLATTAALALAAVAPAQDRGRSGGGDKESRQERSSSSSRSSGGDRPSRSRGDHEARAPRTRDDSRSSQSDSRSSRTDTRTSRDDSRSTGDSRTGRTDTRTSRDDSRSTNQGDPRTNRGDDSRTSSRDRSDRSSGSVSGGDRTGRSNPFDRSNREDRSSREYRTTTARDSGRVGGPPRDRAPIGSPSHEFNRNPSHYDGRGYVEARRFGAPPNHTFLGLQVRRTDVRTRSSFSFGAEFGGLRVGYTSYSGYGGYRRGGYGYGAGFGYPYYAYDPFAPDVVCVASPWYRYSYLPPYIDHTRVIVVHDYPSQTWDVDGWRTYDNDRRDDAIQGAVDDLKDAFEQQSDRFANRLVPESGDIAIFNDGKYDYSLNPDDFQKMFLDGVEQSKTVRYSILEVRTRGDEVRVRARHEYEDSWGATQSVIHTITLRRDRGGDYVIREFGSE